MFWWLSSRSKFHPQSKQVDTEKSRTGSIFRQIQARLRWVWVWSRDAGSNLYYKTLIEYESNWYTCYQVERSWSCVFFFSLLSVISPKVFDFPFSELMLSCEYCWWFSQTHFVFGWSGDMPTWLETETATGD